MDKHAPPKLSPSHEGQPGATPADEPTSCRECRRRRVKCDGAMPVCSVCQKYRRHCLYDKHSRTRLTRKQLTILEERLEKAEALLRSHFSQEQLMEMMNGTVSTATAAASAPASNAAPTPASASAATSAPTPASLPTGSSTATQSTHGFTPTVPTAPPVQEPLPGFPVPSMQSPSNANVLGIAPQSSHGPAGAPPSTDTYDPSGGSLVAPSVADDFEWDEQDSSWSAYGPSLDAPGSNADSSTQAIMDGMASLSVGARRGYLGAVSGAALLRQILSARRREPGSFSDLGGPSSAYSAGGNAGAGQHQQQQGQEQEHFESLFQQEPDQQSHWYRAQSMLTRVAVENLIDAFFTLYHPTFPIVHEPTFRAQYAGLLPRADKDRWNTLANIMAALGSFAGSNCADATDLPIFQAAQRSLFAGNLEAGNLTLVQAFGLSATYLQKRNKPNTGYNYGGIALRMGIGLGLHKEFEEGYISPLQMEIRRRVWWTLCVLDVGATITYGRPLNWPQAGVEAALPRNFHEEDLVSDTAPYPPEVDGITRYTYLRVQSSYHTSTMCIYNRLITPPFPTATELIALDDENITAWYARIPPYYHPFPPADSFFALGIGITKWRYRNLRIVMYRPFLVRWVLNGGPYDPHGAPSPETVAVFRCLDAAKETIYIVEEYWMSRSHSRLAAWYVLYFLFHATMIPIHCLRHNPQHALASDWRAQIRSSLAVMDAMTALSPNSAKCREISLKLCWPHLQEGGEAGAGNMGVDTNAGGNGAGAGDNGRNQGLYGGDEQAQAQAEAAAAAFIPNMGDAEAASMLNGYDAWCGLMRGAGEGGNVPLYQWPVVDDQDLNVFYGADSGAYP